MPHADVWHFYETLQFYPHMGPKDAHIWNAFVVASPRRFSRVLYDCRCGEIEPVPENTPKNIASAWEDLCRGRIDVVADDVDALYVIEVKPRARGEALGQAFNNAHLYAREQRPLVPVHAAVITDFILPSTRIVAAANGIELWTP